MFWLAEALPAEVFVIKLLSHFHILDIQLGLCGDDVDLVYPAQGAPVELEGP